MSLVTRWWLIIGLSPERRREGHWIQSDPEFPLPQLLPLLMKLKCRVGKDFKRTAKQRMKHLFQTEGQIGLWWPIVTNSYCHAVTRWKKKRIIWLFSFMLEFVCLASQFGLLLSDLGYSSVFRSSKVTSARPGKVTVQKLSVLNSKGINWLDILKTGQNCCKVHLFYVY